MQEVEEVHVSTFNEKGEQIITRLDGRAINLEDIQGQVIEEVDSIEEGAEVIASMQHLIVENQAQKQFIVENNQLVESDAENTGTITIGQISQEEYEDGEGVFLNEEHQIVQDQTITQTDNETLQHDNQNVEQEKQENSDIRVEIQPQNYEVLVFPDESQENDSQGNTAQEDGEKFVDASHEEMEITPEEIDPDNIVFTEDAIETQKNEQTFQDNENSLQDTEHNQDSLQNTEHNLQNTEHNLQNNEHNLQNNKHNLQNNEHDLQTNEHELEQVTEHKLKESAEDEDNVLYLDDTIGDAALVVVNMEVVDNEERLVACSIDQTQQADSTDDTTEQGEMLAEPHVVQPSKTLDSNEGIVVQHVDPAEQEQVQMLTESQNAQLALVEGGEEITYLEQVETVYTGTNETAQTVYMDDTKIATGTVYTENNEGLTEDINSDQQMDIKQESSEDAGQEIHDANQ